MRRETQTEPQHREAGMRCGTLAIIRQRMDETVEQAFFRHYTERPEDAKADQTVFLYAPPEGSSAAPEIVPLRRMSPTQLNDMAELAIDG